MPGTFSPPPPKNAALPRAHKRKRAMHDKHVGTWAGAPHALPPADGGAPSRKKSKALGWSGSTLWLTSMIQSSLSCTRMLYSDRSACTSRHFWYMPRIMSTTSVYAARMRAGGSPASRSRGAATPPRPKNSIASTCMRSWSGRGALIPAAFSRARLRISFSAHSLTILRGLDLQ